jgi:hypothetical protein
MKFTTKNALRKTAKDLGLKVKFVDYLPEDIHGKLLPRERRILINANKPRCEHVYTLLHEFAHYLLHFKRIKPHRHSPWYLNINWKSDAIARIAAKVRRLVRFVFHSEHGKEWEADLWAMCGLIYLNKFFGDSVLTAFLNRHPEKKWLYRLAAISTVVSDAKKRITKICAFFGKVRQAAWHQSA